MLRSRSREADSEIWGRSESGVGNFGNSESESDILLPTPQPWLRVNVMHFSGTCDTWKSFVLNNTIKLWAVWFRESYNLKLMQQRCDIAVNLGLTWTFDKWTIIEVCCSETPAIYKVLWLTMRFVCQNLVAFDWLNHQNGARKFPRLCWKSVG